ncbi:MAG: type I restriction endonuclease [Cyanobacteria bacterium P01_D01_bin.6]
MVQTLAANQVTLGDLKRSLGLQQSQDPTFFLEWQADNPTLSQHEQQLLDRVKANFLALAEEPPLLENSVKMVVLSPLLDLAGFYQKPFRIETEKSTELELQDADTVIQGRIDVLVLQAKLWLLVIEAKRSDFAVTRALPQALTYLLSDPNPADIPSFGLITNGTEFLFLKITQQPTPQYANSRLFSLINPQGNELYLVLPVLKSLGNAVLA